MIWYSQEKNCNPKGIFMLKLFTCLFSLMALTGCGPKNSEYYAYTDQGVEKSRVAIIPLIESSKTHLNWDLSDEVIFGIRAHICNDGKLFPLAQADVNANAALLGNVDPFGIDLKPWIGFSNSHFVVVMEMLDHKVVPYEKGKYTSLYPTAGAHSNEILEIRVHLRILDVRHNKARLVLDEIVESNHLMPNAHDAIDYESQAWETPNYCNTPVGIAHNRLIWQLSKRIDTVVSDCR
jgi:hypothetical protein